MIPELAHFALILALLLACSQLVFFFIGSVRQDNSLMGASRSIAVGQCFFIFVSFFLLLFCFITNDFSVVYVAQNSNTQLPLFYRVTGLWGAHEGSILLWLTVLSLWIVAVAIFRQRLPIEIQSSVLATLGLISIGFLIYILTESNPFLRFLPNIPIEGRDLNPLLQDPGLATHPPMLYMGYVGFAVVFAFALSALIRGKLDAAWVRWVRPWTLMAWCFLTLGIILGSWWSYRVLGWGGWWFWDPVENASLLPWLTGTALIHSLIVSEKRGVFRGWTLLLAILAFSFSLLGTFIVRSGVLISVHAFAVDPARGHYLLNFLFLVVGTSLLLYAWRVDKIKSAEEGFMLCSRETFLLFNTVILIVLMFTVLLGTLYPLIIEACGLGKISVGAPYFNTVCIPLFLPLLFLMSLGVQTDWRQMQPQVLLKKISMLFMSSLILALILPWIFFYQISLGVVAALTLAIFIIISTFMTIYSKCQQIGFLQLPLNQYGMCLAHIGLAVLVIGITLNTAYSVEKDVGMTLMDVAEVGGYEFQFVQLRQIKGANYNAIEAKFVVSKNNKMITSLFPERRVYTMNPQNLISKPAITAGVFSDLYIALGDVIDKQTCAFRIYYKPFVRWIWCGGFIMILGGILSTFDHRYKS
jgi:cytochrome c-type biogenesis protein CcmF